MDTLVATPINARAGLTGLRKLYLLRFVFAAVWAALLFTTADTLSPLSVTLLVLYPLFDVACAVIDLRSARAADRPVRALYANVVLSAATAVALAVAAASGIPAVLQVWGVWAVAAGVTQLVVGAVRRRQAAGQWAMIASGAISTLAGASFVAQGSGGGSTTLNNLAGYALLGGVFFLVSALRLKSAERKA
ncbi:hypothetical protein AB0912_12310 [Streptomyces sp. NPDC007084]|uniref:hypothetical protein n=1 Tax=Streptomyces sp. NPDC007084 TaxID=3154313 RepID=UPI00345639AC